MEQMPISLQINLPSFYFPLLCLWGSGYQREQERTHRNSSVACGCSDSLLVALSLLAGPALAALVWRQQHSAVNLKMAFSFLFES